MKHIEAIERGNGLTELVVKGDEMSEKHLHNIMVILSMYIASMALLVSMMNGHWWVSLIAMTWQSVVLVANISPRKDEEMAKRKVDREFVKNRYLDGATINEIADETGKTSGYIAQIVSSMRGSGELPSEKDLDTGKIWALHNAGWSNDRIALDMSITVDEVAETLGGERYALHG